MTDEFKILRNQLADKRFDTNESKFDSASHFGFIVGWNTLFELLNTASVDIKCPGCRTEFTRKAKEFLDAVKVPENRE